MSKKPRRNWGVLVNGKWAHWGKAEHPAEARCQEKLIPLVRWIKANNPGRPMFIQIAWFY